MGTKFLVDSSPINGGMKMNITSTRRAMLIILVIFLGGTIALFSNGCGKDFNFGFGNVEIGAVKPCIITLPDGTNMFFEEFCLEVEADENRNSVFCDLKKRGYDACIAHRAMEILVKEGYVFEFYTEKQFDRWTQETKDMAYIGMSVENLKTQLMLSLAKLNKQSGAQVAILGDGLIQIKGDILFEDDIICFNSSMDDLNEEIKRLAKFFS